MVDKEKYLNKLSERNFLSKDTIQNKTTTTTKTEKKKKKYFSSSFDRPRDKLHTYHALFLPLTPSQFIAYFLS